MSNVEAIREALAVLCYRARVSEDDGSRTAAEAVRSVLARDRHPVTRDNLANPVGCGLVTWLGAATGIPIATLEGTDPSEASFLVTLDRVVYQHPRQSDGTRRREYVELPAAVRAALGAKRRGVGGRKKEAA